MNIHPNSENAHGNFPHNSQSTHHGMQENPPRQTCHRRFPSDLQCSFMSVFTGSKLASGGLKRVTVELFIAEKQATCLQKNIKIGIYLISFNRLRTCKKVPR